MKFDMSGGAAVMGAMQAVAELAIPLNVVGIVPSSENLISGKAVKPGDVIRTREGKTVEVVNTDAEGRLILADALSYAQELKPAAIVDCATLTGACVVALGNQAAAVLGNDEGLVQELRDAGDRSGERCWPLPLWKEYREQLDSNVADLKNVGGRPAGDHHGSHFPEGIRGGRALGPSRHRRNRIRGGESLLPPERRVWSTHPHAPGVDQEPRGVRLAHVPFRRALVISRSPPRASGSRVLCYSRSPLRAGSARFDEDPSGFDEGGGTRRQPGPPGASRRLHQSPRHPTGGPAPGSGEAFALRVEHRGVGVGTGTRSWPARPSPWRNSWTRFRGLFPSGGETGALLWRSRPLEPGVGASGSSATESSFCPWKAAWSIWAV